MKTRTTLELEQALISDTEKNGFYGVQEVTIGFVSQGMGNEIADFLSMDAKGTFRCYELKVTLSDLKSENKLSWYGDYNYLVVSATLEQRVSDWSLYIPDWVGILVGNDLRTYRRATRIQITDSRREMLKDSLLRSMAVRLETYRKAADPAAMHALEKENEDLKQMVQDTRDTFERMQFTYHDYEAWYRKNHQDPSFTLEKGARRQREETKARTSGELVWKMDGDGNAVCPVCGRTLVREGESVCYPFCPWCGSDLRRMK
ncbi:MAG: MmcB family DNA repair protein [Galactobacillus timonensis]|nr:MmcB family DNA repair protein [Galactobacillus timonensis]